MRAGEQEIFLTPAKLYMHLIQNNFISDSNSSKCIPMMPRIEFLYGFFIQYFQMHSKVDGFVHVHCSVYYIKHKTTSLLENVS